MKKALSRVKFIWPPPRLLPHFLREWSCRLVVLEASRSRLRPGPPSLPNRTLPNRTLPNRTLPNRTGTLVTVPIHAGTRSVYRRSPKIKCGKYLQKPFVNELKVDRRTYLWLKSLKKRVFLK